jgi:FkbM family methyltransferase
MKLVHSIRKRINYWKPFPQVATYRGARFVLDPREGLDKKILIGHAFEPVLLEFALRRVRERKLSHVIDVGANFGLYAVVLGKLDCVETVDAFEPVRRTFNQLCANVYANRLDDKIEAHRCALGDENGTASIHLSRGNSAISRFAVHPSDTPGLFTGAETVMVRTGDAMLPISNKNVYIKIDVERHAESVIRGMPRLLQSNAGIVQVEAERTDHELIALLRNHDWKMLDDMSSEGGIDIVFEK